MHLPVGIVTTASRKAYLEKTLAALNHPGIEVLCDLSPGHQRNHMSAWHHLFRNGAQRALLIQDDVEASRGWYDVACAFARVKAWRFVTLYSALGESGKRTPMVRGYFTVKDWINEQALILDASFYYNFTMWVRENRDHIFQKHTCHDGMLKEYLKVSGEKVIGSAPSLFQHTGVASTMGHNWKVGKYIRQSRSYQGADFNAQEHFRELPAA